MGADSLADALHRIAAASQSIGIAVVDPRMIEEPQARLHATVSLACQFIAMSAKKRLGSRKSFLSLRAHTGETRQVARKGSPVACAPSAAW